MIDDITLYLICWDDSFKNWMYSKLVTIMCKYTATIFILLTTIYKSSDTFETFKTIILYWRSLNIIQLNNEYVNLKYLKIAKS